MQRGVSAATFTHPARLTDNDRQKKPKLLPPAGPSSSVLPSFAPGSSRQPRRSAPPVRTIQKAQPLSLRHWTDKEREEEVSAVSPVALQTLQTSCSQSRTSASPSAPPPRSPYKLPAPPASQIHPHRPLPHLPFFHRFL